MMTDSYLGVAPDSTDPAAKKMRSRTSTVAGALVHTEAVFLVDPVSGDQIGGTLTPGLVVANSDGFVAAGAVMASFQPDQNFVGSIQGVNYPTQLPIFSWEAPFPYTLGQINYTVSSGTLTIQTLRP